MVVGTSYEDAEGWEWKIYTGGAIACFGSVFLFLILYNLNLTNTLSQPPPANRSRNTLTLTQAPQSNSLHKMFNTPDTTPSSTPVGTPVRSPVLTARIMSNESSPVLSTHVSAVQVLRRRSYGPIS
jgi:hypothetical protein